MADLDALGLDGARLSARLDFLATRAGQDVPRDIVSVAPDRRDAAAFRIARRGALHRDAAAVALLLDRPETAVEHLTVAGRAWTEIGLPTGLAYLSLAGRAAEARAMLDRVVVLLEQSGPDETVKSEGHGRAAGPSDDGERKDFLRDAVRAPNQLLALYQTSLLAEFESHVRYRLRHWALVHLEPSASLGVGPDGLALSSYVALCEGETRDSVLLDLSVALRARDRRLARARDDRYHWRRMLDPAGVVDFDLAMLAMSAARRAESTAARQSFEQVFRSEFEGEPRPAAAVPLEVAQTLMRYGGRRDRQH